MDPDQQLDQLTDEELVAAINRRAQRKAAADPEQTREADHRRASLESMRSAVKRRFGKDVSASGDSVQTTPPVQGSTAGKAEAARRFPKGN